MREGGRERDRQTDRDGESSKKEEREKISRKGKHGERERETYRT